MAVVHEISPRESSSIHHKNREWTPVARQSDAYQRYLEELRVNAMEKYVKECKKAIKYFLEIYETYDPESPEVKELKRIIYEGKSGLGVLDSAKQLPDNIWLCKSNEEFAYALGTELFVSTAMMNRLNSEDKIASIGAHEGAHVQQLHGLKQYDLESLTHDIEDSITAASLPRIHEWEAETISPFRVDQAGYRASEYRSTLELFINPGNNNSDFAHGSLYDRMSWQGYLAQLHDFEHSQQEPTPKPRVLEHLEEKDSRIKQLLTAISTNNEPAIQELLPFFSLSTLMSLFNRLLRQLLFDSSQLTDANELKTIKHQISKLQKIIEGIVDETVLVASEPEKTWSLYITFASYDAVINFYSPKQQSKSNSETLDLVNGIDIHQRFLQSIDTPERFVAFFEFAHQFRRNHRTRSVVSNPRSLLIHLWETLKSSGDESWNSILDELLLLPSFQDCFLDQDGNILLTEFTGYLSTLTAKVRNGRQKAYGIPELLQKHTVEPMIVQAQEIQTIKLKTLQSNDFEQAKDYLYSQEETLLLPIILQFVKVHETTKHLRRSRNYGSLIADFSQSIGSIVQVYYRSISRSLNDPFVQTRTEHHLIQALTRVDASLSDYHLALQEGIQPGDIASVYQSTNFFTIDHLRSYLPQTHLHATGSMYAVDELHALFCSPDSSFIDTRIPQDTRLIQLYSEIFEEFEIPTETNPSEEQFTITVLHHSEPLRVNRYDLECFGYIANVFDFVRSLPDPSDFEQACRSILDKVEPFRLSTAGRVLLLGTILEELKRSANYRSSNELSASAALDGLYAHPILITLRDEYVQFVLQQNPTISRLYTQISRVASIAFGKSDEETLIGKSPTQQNFLGPLLSTMIDALKRVELDEHSLHSLWEVYELLPILLNRRETEYYQYKFEMIMVKLMTFDQAIAFLDYLFENSKVNIHVLDYVQEQLMNSKEEFERFDALFQRNIDSITRTGEQKITLLATTDERFDYFLGNHAIELFEAAMDTGSDSKLRELLAPFWIHSVILSVHSNRDVKIMLDDTGHPYLLGDIHSYRSFDTFVNSFYTSLTQPEIDYLLRRMLFAPNGLLTTQEGRTKLYHLVLSKAIEPSKDPSANELVEDLLFCILSVDKHDDETLTIHPTNLGDICMRLLRNQLFIQPNKRGDNTAAADRIGKNTEFVGGNQFDLSNFMYFEREVRQDLEQLQEDLRTENDENELPIVFFDTEDRGATLGVEIATRILDFNPSETTVGQSIEIEDFKAQKERLLHSFRSGQRNTQTKRYTPIESMILLADSKGPMGVRYKQNATVAHNLAKEYEEALQSSFDSVRGQLKYTAMRSFRREALGKNAAPTLKEVWHRLM